MKGRMKGRMKERMKGRPRGRLYGRPRGRLYGRMRGVVGALGMLVACGRGGAGSDGAAPAAERAPIAVGDSLPVLAVHTLAGEPVQLGGAGAAATLVNVWATWCTSCREEMADLEALHRELAPRGLRVVAVSIDEGDGARVRRFVQKQGLTFAVVHDSASRVQRAYGVVGVPESYVLDAQGRLRWHRTGGIHGGTREARQAVESLLAAH